jgi:hypothetical protein
VEPTPVTNEELGNTVDDLSGNLTESATEEEVIGNLEFKVILYKK